MAQSKTTFILDLGTGYTKFGLASDAFPQINIPTCIGYPSYAVTSENNNNTPLFGEDAYNFNGSIQREELFDKKKLKDFDLLRNFIRYLFKKIKTTPANTQLIIAQGFDWSTDFINKLRDFLINEYFFESIVMENSDYFALNYHNLTTGLVLDVGYFTSRAISYNNQKMVPNMLLKTNVGSKNVTEYLKSLLLRQFKFIKSPIFDSLAERVKLNKCWFANNIEDSLSNKEFLTQNTEQIEVPQFKTMINLGIEKILTPEVLFQPTLANIPEASIDEIVLQSLKNCHPSLRQILFKNIVIVGGAAEFKNFEIRLKQKFDKIALLANSKLYLDEQPKFTIWKGMKKFVDSGQYQTKVSS